MKVSIHRLWRAAICWVGLVVLAGETIAQQAPDASSATSPDRLHAISGNPAATNFSTGTGWIGRTLGLRPEWGVTLGGLWLADTNLLMAGGRQPGGWTSNSALFIGLSIDAEKLIDWRGASFGFQFMQLNFADTNGEAGSVPGYNNLGVPAPRQRTELAEAWYMQEVVKDVLKVRVGRSFPTYDFNNVLRPLELADGAQNIPAVSGLLTPTAFINGSILGALPGPYNPGNGVTVNFTPTRRFYLNLGAYDGNLARPLQTGVYPPQFNGYYFNIAEIGTAWLLGDGKHPGQFGVGLWHQTGSLTAPGIVQDGTGGFYLQGSQRVAYGVNPGVTNSSISVFYQLGANNSLTLPITQFYGAGITGFGLIGSRSLDSMGLGVGFSRLNPAFLRSSELMFQAYYQAHVHASTFLQPTLTFIPTPGASPSVPAALAGTMRLTVLF